MEFLSIRDRYTDMLWADSKTERFKQGALMVGAVLANLSDRVVVFCAHDVNWVARYATHVLGLGLQQNAPGWFFDTCEAALQADQLHQLYDCRWTQLRDANGLSAWVAL